MVNFGGEIVGEKSLIGNSGNKWELSVIFSQVEDDRKWKICKIVGFRVKYHSKI